VIRVDRLGSILTFAIAIATALLVFGCGGGGGDGGGDGGTSGQSSPPEANPSPVPPSPPPPVAAYKTPYPFVDVLHNVMEFDPTRRLLYAYVAPGDTTHPKSFAIINVDTLAVKYSAPVDFVPWRLRVSSDGKYLYVATANTREVVRLTLPDFKVDIRLNLGLDPVPIFGGLGQPFDAGDIAVSTQDSRQFVVSLVHLDYYTCAIGLRTYRDATKLAELYHDDVNAPSLGDALAIDPAGRLVTVCTGQSPDTVTRLSMDRNALTILDTRLGVTGISSSVEVSDIAILTGVGAKFDMPQFALRGNLRPLTLDPQGDPAPLLYGCIFADEAGAVAACISHTDITDGFPTFRAFVLYELTDANSFGSVPLDLAANNHATKIIRLGGGHFAVSVGPSLDAPFLISAFHFLQQNTRIYFLSGISTSFP
jgi:hypothetical protein